MGMAPGPAWIIRSAGKTDHAAIEQEKTKKREHDHAVRGTPNVRDGIQRNLATEVRGVVAAAFGNEGMSGFVASGGEKKDGIINEAEDQELWRDVWH